MVATRRFAFGFAPAGETEALARKHALRAAELDREMGEAISSVAHIDFVFDWKWSSAEEGFRRALELNQASLDICYCLAVFLNAMGRSEEAVEHMQSAVRRNPRSANLQTWLGASLMFARRPDEAIPPLLQAREMAPRSARVNGYLASALQLAGRPDEAVQVLERLAPSGALGLAYAVAGRHDAAKNIAKTIRTPMDLARIHAALGNKTEALRLLSEAIDQRAFDALFIKVDPAFDSLRSDAAFQSQLARLKIPD
jgi:tetratricopeptide (TPR) repeat protein